VKRGEVAVEVGVLNCQMCETDFGVYRECLG